MFYLFYTSFFHHSLFCMLKWRGSMSFKCLCYFINGRTLNPNLTFDLTQTTRVRKSLWEILHYVGSHKNKNNNLNLTFLSQSILEKCVKFEMRSTRKIVTWVLSGYFLDIFYAYDFLSWVIQYLPPLCSFRNVTHKMC